MVLDVLGCFGRILVPGLHFERVRLRGRPPEDLSRAVRRAQ